MAAENEIQFFEAPFQYSIWEFSSNVNLTYHKLINTEPVKMPQMNTGFETNFSQARLEKWDKSYFWIRKRKWFKRCDEIEEEISSYVNYIVTDHQVVNWKRFLMQINNAQDRLKVYMCHKWDYIDCIPTPQDVCNWDWEYLWTYQTTPCSYHKFQKITTLQSDKETKLRHLNAGTVVYNDWTTTSILFRTDREAIEWLVPWKFVQLYYADEESSSGNDTVVWQALQVWNFDAKNWWYNMWYGSWIWITDKQQMDLFDEYWNKIWVINYQSEIDVLVYDRAELWIAFYWWKETKNQWWIWEWNWHWFTFMYQTNLSHANVTSLTEDFDWLVYTTDRWTLNFMRPHSNTWQSLWWTIYSTHNMYWWRDLAKSCWDYVFLFWPDTIWIAYKNWTDERWDHRWNIQILDRNMWYRSKDSVLVYNEEMYMIDNKKRFVKLDIEATTDAAYRAHFKLQATDMSLHWINTDLRNLDRSQWDNAILCKEWTRIYIIINDSRNVRDSRNEVLNTKILVYEDELKYWHRWYLCWIDIRWIHWWVWFWRWVYLYTWNYDCWEYETVNDKKVPVEKPFKEIISMSFWDTSWFTWKEVLWIKAAIWYHSKISKDTIFKFRADWWWFSTTIKMNRFDDTVNYVNIINELRDSWKTDMNKVEALMRWMPIWIWMYSWNWVWLIKDEYRTQKTEFEQYCDYEPTMTYRTDTCCDPKPASEPDGNGCTMKAPEPDEQNFWSDRFQYHYNIAKYSTMKVNIWQQWQNFFFELIANNYDEIEFCWFMIWWMFMDNNFDSLANTPYYQTTPKESLPWMMWK